MSLEEKTINKGKLVRDQKAANTVWAYFYDLVAMHSSGLYGQQYAYWSAATSSSYIIKINFFSVI
jgi:hypothetical protein